MSFWMLSLAEVMLTRKLIEENKAKVSEGSPAKDVGLNGVFISDTHKFFENLKEDEKIIFKKVE